MTFMLSTRKSRFLTPPSVHMRQDETDPTPFWTSTYHRHDKHTNLLKQLIHEHWPSRPKTEIRLYDCNLFKTVLLVIVIYLKLYY